MGLYSVEILAAIKSNMSFLYSRYFHVILVRRNALHRTDPRLCFLGIIDVFRMYF